MSKGGRSNEAENQDTHDDMSNIDLDYRSAVAAKTIETVARVAHTPAGPLC